MKTQNTTQSGQFQNQISKRCTIGTTKKQIPDHLLSWLGSDTFMKNGGVNLVCLAQTFPLEMIRSCKCFPQVNTMSTIHSVAVF